MTEQELRAAGYTRVDSLTRYSTWVSAESGELFVHDATGGELRPVVVSDMLSRVVLRLLEGSGELLGDAVEEG